MLGAFGIFGIFGGAFGRSHRLNLQGPVQTPGQCAPCSLPLLCTIIGISDGDTLKARCATDDGAQTYSIRLAEIDAPEKGQPFRRAQQAISGSTLLS